MGLISENTQSQQNSFTAPDLGSLNINEILQIACNTILDFFGEEVLLVNVVLKDSDDESHLSLEAIASNIEDFPGKSRRDLFKKNYKNKISSSYEGTAFAECLESKSIVKEDISELKYKESSLLNEEGASYRVLFPINKSGDCLGTLNISSTNKDLLNFPSEYIETICSQLSVAIENSRRFERAKTHARRSLELSQVFYQLNKSQDLDSIITETVNGLQKIMGASRAFYAGIAIDDWIIQAEAKANDELRSFLGMSGSTDLEVFFNENNLGVKSFIYMPIKMKGKVCGLLGLSQEDRKRKWSKDDIELLDLVKEQVSLAISQAQLINDLRTSNERLLELDKVKSQLMSTVSHELRTPMANILGFSELLLNRNVDPEINKQYLSEIFSASQKLSNLIQDFLDLSRIEATGKLPLGAFEELDIDWIAENAWNQLGNQNKDHKIKWIKPENLTAAIGDADSLTRVFTNLFSNAIKYSQKGTTITCRFESNQNDLFICVEDQGSGIPEAMISSIFDRFFRVDNTDTRKIGGTGLGLAISKEIIKSHHGQIWCESTVDVGSKFFFTLPIITDQREVSSQAQIWLS